MTIHVIVFASLSEQLGITETDISAKQVQTVQSIWDTISEQAADASVRVAINQSYAQFSDTVTSGDEVAFFPPVTGG